MTNGKKKDEVIEGEVLDEGGLSGGLVPARQEEVVNVPGLTSDAGDVLGPTWIKVNQDGGGFDAEGEIMPALVGSILGIKYSYTRFDRDDKGDPVLGPPKCRSLDRITGVGDPGGECRKCNLKEWPDAGGKPDCSHTCVLLLAIDVGKPNPEPAYLRLKGTSVKPAEKFVRSLARKYTRNIWRGLVRITTGEEKYQGAKKYHVAAFEQIENRDFLEVPAVHPVLAELRAQLEDGYGRAVVERDEPEKESAVF